ncbi:MULTISPECIES: NAD(P)-dependent oxidoreductase [Pseudoalteromonas]|jgi:3-hydroxyisobutyrate dehydrogenase-like beta-hydroxyacid dehydrogenase|uniref:6-phosphogluconate dehydrogenase n=4 Tax=Pseudoalteromonas TaxID=53246 RepID=A0A063KWK2_9GAMM|nr:MULTISPECIES: NAD(P)-dependent oxidoreductase [Pseudoalteromonas]ALQ08668.1 6-phosphogluconate dehydrogenase [Pseudoalteromonas sp. Bsw20308]ALQ55174.1 6-phosphogluconate dehydrogenase [Pseudoalteromonas issachenkonii]ATC91016.1 3-hydroxyisobutyrate dehydrogenase [Pseudoalteromonas issachenkonii]ATG77132.1 6-phosphogluconate dehydrogenase [Pseudoalteromonas sp. 1_2015MBL_MicDiv]EGI71375.1 putative tartronate semialdehyde reductase [Pseudoalteromonas distincta]|tara:strand:- start:1 stop:879 length:879 start_codon:yes stop_codon:yes gene_type:complete
MSKPVIGFIGLGLMGGNMAENLQNKGYELIVMDLSKDAVAACVARGAKTASTAKELAEGSDIVMFCLTTSAVVEKIVYAEDGILAGIKEGAVLVDFGTSIPSSTKKIGADLAAKGAGMIDAPLGRTPAHAKDGLLNIMAAGDIDTFNKVKPVLEDQGENVFHLGELGAGHTTKLINNFMGMTTVCAMSQAFAVAELAGVDRQQLFDIMSTGPSNSPFMQFCKNYAVDNVSDLGFSIANANKDLGYFLQMVEDLGTESKIAEGSSANLQAAFDAGMGQGNVPEIFDYFKKLEK